SMRRQLDLASSKEQVAAATAEILVFSDRLVARYRQADQASLISALIDAVGHKELSLEEAVATASLLLMNVTDPRVPPLTTGPITLLLHQEQLASCQADRSLWTKAAAEVLRYHNNGITNFPRVTLTETDVAGVSIAAGEGVITSTLAASHDPQHFPE